MKRLLVPTDFSDNSLPAVRFAAAMARQNEAEIYLLHVLEEGYDTDAGSIGSGSWAGASDVITVPYMIKRLQLVKRQMNDIIKKTELYGLNVQDEIETGEAYMKITAAADKYDADLIIMGTHGVRGWKEIFVGSTAEKVVQHSRRPVLSIKEKVNTAPGKIVFATDFENEAHHALHRVLEFADSLNASVELVTVGDNSVELKRKVNRFFYFAETDLPYTIYNDKNTEAGIIHYAEKVNADIIAIGTHGRSGLARFFSPSLSEHLVNHSFLPVLTVNF